MTKLSETLSRLAEIKARADSATAGPWSACGNGECQCKHVGADDAPIAKVESGPWGDEFASVRLVGESLSLKVEPFTDMIEYGSIPQEVAAANSRFIAAARTDVPQLASALEEARALLERLEWSGLDMSSDPDSTMGPWACCPFCHAPEGNRHGPNCKLAAALGR